MSSSTARSRATKCRPNYRDVALFFQDEDNIIGTSFMPYVQNVAGLTGVNYRSEPYKYREEQGCSLGKVFQPCKADKPEDPATPDHRSACGRSRAHSRDRREQRTERHVQRREA